MNNVCDTAESENNLQRLGEIFVRYSLVIVIAWIGCLKFTVYESQGVFKHASHSPLLSWAYAFLSERNFSRALGTVELIIAFLIAVRPVWPKASAWGSLGGIAMFLTTLSFLATTPGAWQEGYGFPALSGAVGQFLIKDLVLLGAAVWTAGEAFCEARCTLQRPVENSGQNYTANAST